MSEINKMSEEELRAHLKKMEKNKEKLKFQEQRIWKEEEEEEFVETLEELGIERLGYNDIKDMNKGAEMKG